MELPIRAAPYQHQQKAVEFALATFETSPGVALLCDMGTGKSLISIAITGLLKLKKVLIACPLSVVGVWQEEFEKFADFDYDLRILTGTTVNKVKTLKNMDAMLHCQIAVCNYESVRLMQNEILDWSADLVICDEMHKIKTHNSKVSRSLHIIGSIARYRLGLTGTAITNKALDVFSQYKFLNPMVFGTSYYTFRNKYFDSDYMGYTWTLKKSMEQDLMDKIHSIAFRATKKECLDLPETTDINRYVELEPEAKQAYMELEKHFVTEIENGDITASNILTRLLRLSQLTGGFITTDESDTPINISNAKLLALKDLIENADGKVVIIAHFIPEIQAILKMLGKMGIKYARIYGGIKDRQDEITQFQNDPDTKVFVGQIGAAGLGITLTASSTMIFYSCDYSMANFEQCKARIHRSGQTEKCTYYYLIAKDTVDKKILKALEKKSNLAKELIDNYGKR